MNRDLAKETITTGLKFILTGNYLLQVAKRFGYKVRTKDQSKSVLAKRKPKKRSQPIDVIVRTFGLQSELQPQKRSVRAEVKKREGKTILGKTKQGGSR
jgi:hypothetical protein